MHAEATEHAFKEALYNLYGPGAAYSNFEIQSFTYVRTLFLIYSKEILEVTRFYPSHSITRDI